jgi:CBS domain-containing protein
MGQPLSELQTAESTGAASASRESRAGNATLALLKRRPETIGRDDPIAAIPELFMGSSNPAVIVTNATGRPLGIIRPGDLFRAIDAHRSGNVLGMVAVDLATPALIFQEDEPVAAASALMARQNQDCAIVVNGDGMVTGLVTAGDALAYRSGVRMAYPEASPLQSRAARGSIPVRRLMHAPPVVRTEEPMSVLSRRLATSPSNLVIVVDRALRPVGSVTPVELIGRAAGHGRDTFESLTVADVMTPGVVQLDADDTLDRAATTFATQGVAWLAVCEGSALVGMVRAEELLAYLWTRSARR